MGVGEAICTMREIVAIVNRPQDIEEEEAMTFFGGSESDAEESQGATGKTEPLEPEVISPGTTVWTVPEPTSMILVVQVLL